MKKTFILLIVVLTFSCKATHFIREDIQKSKIYKFEDSTAIEITSLITTVTFTDGYTNFYPGIPGHYFAKVKFLVRNNSNEKLIIDFNKIQLKSQEGQIYNPEQINLNFTGNLNAEIKPLDFKNRTLVFHYPYKQKPAYFIYKGEEYKIIYN